MERILTEPKNALIKQYKKLFELDGVELKFTDEAINTIAKKAVERKTGARGLRAILENAVMDIMYETPSDETIKECIVNEDVINGLADPELVYNSVIGKKKAKKNKDKTAYLRSIHVRKYIKTSCNTTSWIDSITGNYRSF